MILRNFNFHFSITVDGLSKSTFLEVGIPFLLASFLPRPLGSYTKSNHLIFSCIALLGTLHVNSTVVPWKQQWNGQATIQCKSQPSAAVLGFLPVQMSVGRANCHIVLVLGEHLDIPLESQSLWTAGSDRESQSWFFGDPQSLITTVWSNFLLGLAFKPLLIAKVTASLIIQKLNNF